MEDLKKNDGQFENLLNNASFRNFIDGKTSALFLSYHGEKVVFYREEVGCSYFVLYPVDDFQNVPSIYLNDELKKICKILSEEIIKRQDANLCYSPQPIVLLDF